MIKLIRVTATDGTYSWINVNAIASIASTSEHAWDGPPPNANALIELVNDTNHFVSETVEQVLQRIDALTGETTIDGGNF